jgi:hypothetical protein
LQVPTYDVVPITPALGMLAFVGGTKPLLNVISPDLVDANGKANDSFYAGIHVCALFCSKCAILGATVPTLLPLCGGCCALC